MIEVKHENGYRGILYGEQSMVIFGPDGREVLHTGFRNKQIKTAEDLYKHLETMPEFLKVLYEGIEENGIDDIDDNENDF